VSASRFVVVDRSVDRAEPPVAVHVTTGGDPSGTPVIMLNGLSGTAWDWDPAVDALGDEGWYAVRYDRPGQGSSGALRRDPTLATEVALLWTVAEAAGVDRPAVLVGHAYGALLARAAAATDPARIRGCVLIDPRVHRSAGRDPVALRRRGRWTRAPLRVLAALNGDSNAVRLTGPWLGRYATWAGSAGPAASRVRPEAWHTALRRPEVLIGTVGEHACHAAVAAEAAALHAERPFPPVPVAVLCGGGGRLRSAGARRVAAQRDLAETLGGSFRLLPDAGHLVMLDRPGEVADAVRAVGAGTMTA
jgi:pimeloyl-ACP methyl ester carboxylesterase